MAPGLTDIYFPFVKMQHVPAGLSRSQEDGFKETARQQEERRMERRMERGRRGRNEEGGGQWVRLCSEPEPHPESEQTVLCFLSR